MKTGYKTTEFWITVVTNLTAILGALQGTINPDVATIGLTVLNSVYTILRTISKNTEMSLVLKKEN